MLVTYRVRNFLDKYRCIDHVQKVRLYKIWYVGSLLYGYIDRFNIMTIGLEDVISIEE